LSFFVPMVFGCEIRVNHLNVRLRVGAAVGGPVDVHRGQALGTMTAEWFASMVSGATCDCARGAT
jgi:hypothetical protein